MLYELLSSGITRVSSDILATSLRMLRYQCNTSHCMLLLHASIVVITPSIDIVINWLNKQGEMICSLTNMVSRFRNAPRVHLLMKALDSD